MTRRSRRTTFYVLLGLFFVLGAIVILYAEGWRIDFKTWQPEKVGAIFVRSFPESASITLDGTSIPNTAGFLSHGTLIPDLYPRSYTLTLNAPGYDAWHENAAVAPSLVTEFNDAVLVPAKSTPMASNTLKAPSVATSTASTIVAKNAALLEANGLNPANIQSIMSDPYNGTKIVITTMKRIWLFNAAAQTVSPIEEGSTTIPGQGTTLQWITSNELGILQADGSLDLEETNTASIQKLASGVTHFAATPDGSLIAALETNGLEIFPFTSAETYHRFNLPNAESAIGIVWYKDMEHLFVMYPDHVAFLSLDDLDLANFTTIAEIENGTTPIYDLDGNVLSVTDAQGNLVQFDFSS